jgi:hypothetical protein
VLSDFLGPYLVTIAGVVTTGVAAFAGRWVWRWTHPDEPDLVRLQVTVGSAHVLNAGDFDVHLISIEAPPPDADPWEFRFPKAKRVAPGNVVNVDLQLPTHLRLRIDRPFRITLTDDHHARWDLLYAANDASLGHHRGAGPSAIRRVWPRWLMAVAEVLTEWKRR